MFFIEKKIFFRLQGGRAVRVVEEEGRADICGAHSQGARTATGPVGIGRVYLLYIVMEVFRSVA